MDLKFPPRPLSFACLARTLRLARIFSSILRFSVSSRALASSCFFTRSARLMAICRISSSSRFSRCSSRSDLLVACENPESEVMRETRGPGPRRGGERPPTLELRRDEGGARRRQRFALARLSTRGGVAPTRAAFRTAPAASRRTQSRATGTPFGGRGRVSSRVWRGIDVKRRPGCPSRARRCPSVHPRGAAGARGDLAAWKLAIRGGASRWCDARGGAYRFPGDGGKTRRPGLGMSSGEGL